MYSSMAVVDRLCNLVPRSLKVCSVTVQLVFQSRFFEHSLTLCDVLCDRRVGAGSDWDKTKVYNLCEQWTGGGFTANYAPATAYNS